MGLDSLISVPRVAVIVGLAMTGYLMLRGGIGPKQTVQYDRFRRAGARLLHPILNRVRGIPLLRDKTGRQDEAIAVVDAGRGELLRALFDAGFGWNPVSRVKFRDLSDGRRQFALSLSYVESVDAEFQQDVHIFPSPGSRGYDVYGHWEPSVTEPDAHLGGEHQQPGDPERIVRDALDEAGLEYRQP